MAGTIELMSARIFNLTTAKSPRLIGAPASRELECSDHADHKCLALIYCMAGFLERGEPAPNGRTVSDLGRKLTDVRPPPAAGLTWTLR